MKQISIIGTIALWLCTVSLLSSCDLDSQDDNKSEGYATINANVQTNNLPEQGDPLILGDNEYYIQRVRIYAFDGNQLDNMVYKENLSPNAATSVVMEMKVKQTDNKTLYVIVNEPRSMSSVLGLINHPDAFEKIEYKMADYFSTDAMNWSFNFNDRGFVLPMFGKLEAVNTITATPATPIQKRVIAMRSLARVDVMVQKEEALSATPILFNNNSSISIINTRDKGMIAPTAVIPVGSLTNKSNAGQNAITVLTTPVRAGSTDRSKAVRAFTFYTPEHDCSTDLSKLRFKLNAVSWAGTNQSYDVIINKETNGVALNQITRNKVYQIYCTFTQKEMDVSFTMSDWTDKFYDANVPPGTKFTVSQSKVLLDYKRLGNKYTATVNLYATKGGTAEKIEYNGYEHNGRFNTGFPSNWLTLNSVNVTTIGQGVVTVTYKIDATVPKYPLYLWFKAGNIKKRIEFIYYHNR